VPRRFKDFESYRKYVAYLHIHGIPHDLDVPIYIAGKLYRPKRSGRR
jgi:hypothetical protein